MIVAAATHLEERAARKELSGLGVRVVQTGIGKGGRFNLPVISCGLAGGLRRGVPSGTVLIPEEIARPNGERIRCAPDLVERLTAAARALGENPLNDPLVTGMTLVRGEARSQWAARGFAGVDMESGTLYAPKIAVVRVILDTPEHELSDAWLKPATVFFRSRAWRELPWLARNAPRFAHLAARIIRKALEEDAAGT